MTAIKNLPTEMNPNEPAAKPKSAVVLLKIPLSFNITKLMMKIPIERSTTA